MNMSLIMAIFLVFAYFSIYVYFFIYLIDFGELGSVPECHTICVLNIQIRPSYNQLPKRKKGSSIRKYVWNILANLRSFSVNYQEQTLPFNLKILHEQK